MRTRESVWAQERRVDRAEGKLREARDILHVRMEDYLQGQGWKRQRVQNGSRWHSSTTMWIPPKADVRALYTLMAAWLAQIEREKGAARRARAKVKAAGTGKGQ